MSSKVNKNIFKSSLSTQEKKEAYEEIKKACTRKFITLSKTPDLKRIRQIFSKYFNPSQPLLDINATIEDSTFTPLMTTSFLGFNEETEELLKLGAKLESFTETQITALHYAATNNRKNVLHSLLMKFPEYVNSKTNKGQTPLMCSAEAGNFDMVKDLIEKYKANPRHKDNEDKMAADYAAKNKKHTIESYLRYISLNEVLDKSGDKKITKLNKI